MKVDLESLSREAFWRSICPEVPITGCPFLPDARPYAVNAAALDAAQASLARDGYLVLPPLVPATEAAPLAALVQAVTAAGLPAPFALVYDLPWQMLQRLAPVFARFLGPEIRLVPDFWIWQIDGQHESKGWYWHRDKIDEAGFFDAQGRPLVLTVWVPFTDATLHNGCIEVLPGSCDPYLPDKLDQMQVGPELEHAVRPLPVPAGSPIAWHSHALHRGRAYTPQAENPRISMGMYLQSAESSLFKGRAIRVGDEVPLLDRLGMVGRMLHQYDHHYQREPGLLDATRPLVRLYEMVSQRRAARGPG